MKKPKPTMKNNSLYPNTKYVNKDMYMTDNKNNQVIDDTLTRNERFKKQRNERVKHLIRLGAPPEIIEHEKHIATLTIAEYEIFLDEQEKEEKKFLNEYIKKNPLKPEVINELFDAFEELLKKKRPMMDSFICFTRELDPLLYVDEYEYDIGVYDELINSFWVQYNEKWPVVREDDLPDLDDGTWFYDPERDVYYQE